ncbi:MAG: dicarboxylate/amino acid:cation symporter [Muribaculaceae bacterium]|nr:dicarboxylate/amino acid:cation symporter [Muribaculaceae bacterium]
MNKKIKVNLLTWILIAVLSGIFCGQFFPLWLVRGFVTFNSIFSNFLSFCIPLIIIGFVAPAIGEIGKGVGKLLAVTILLSYSATVGAGILSYFTSVTFFPIFLGSEISASEVVSNGESITPYFTIPMPPLMDIMSALVLSFVLGAGVTVIKSTRKVLFDIMIEFREIVSRVITKIIVPLLPVYIFGIFMNMAFTGEVASMLSTFFKIIIIIFVLHIVWLLILYVIGAFFSRGSKNPFKLLWAMMPAYFTALGTQSSAATIPVTLRQTIKMGVDKEIAGFTIPLCATIDLSGSALKIVACSLALMMTHGMSFDFPMFLYFIAMMGITLVAAPGVPGGAIMAALGLLSSILGFSDADNALIIALYITMDSFGTACNVTGDGALSLIIDRFFSRTKEKESPVPSLS